MDRYDYEERKAKGEFRVTCSRCAKPFDQTASGQTECKDCKITNLKDSIR